MNLLRTPCCLAALFCVSVVCARDASLEALYLFDASAKDQSGNGHNGSVHGPLPTSDRFGRSGRAYAFNGGHDFIEVGTTLQLGLPFSIAGWIKAADSQQGTVFRNDQNTGSAYYGLKISVYQGGLALRVNNGGFPSDESRTAWQMAAPLPLDSWHHIAVVLTNANAVGFFVDGVAVAVNHAGGNAQTVGYSGRNPGAFGYDSNDSVGFRGSLDDFRIYHRALAKDEVAALARSTEVPPIVSQPQDLNVPAGSGATFGVTATGENLSYQWLFNGVPISGATQRNYIIQNVQSVHEGGYSVIVRSLGSLTSVVAQLKVLLPHAATATATVTNGFLVGFPITDEGYGYTNTPRVRIFDSVGSGAEGSAEVSDGMVTNIAVLNPGRGYTSTPIVVIAPPFVPQSKMDITALSLLRFSNLDVAGNYQLEYISGGSVRPLGSAFIASSSTLTQMVSGTASINSYRLTPSPAPIQAQAKAQVVNGFVVGATVTSGGSGYTINPLVSILGAGSGATATATVIGGSVAAINITNPGIGFMTTTSIIIAPPPTTSLFLDDVTQVMKLDFRDLSPYDNYQVESVPAATGVWTNFNASFTPTSMMSTQYLSVTGDLGFFRVKYMPTP